MQEGMAFSERTPLTGAEMPPMYVYHASTMRHHRKRVRQFQCFICAGILSIFLIALIMSISLEMAEEDASGNDTDNATVLPPNAVFLFADLNFPLNDSTIAPLNMTLTDEDLQMIEQSGVQALSLKDQYEGMFNRILPFDTPSYRHAKAIPTSPEALELSRAGYASGYATKELVQMKNLTIPIILPSISFNVSWWPDQYCSAVLDNTGPCEWTKYRTVDGHCNNLKHPSWGAAMTPFRRGLPADYSDGISEPRLSSNGNELPSAREISVVVHRPVYRDDKKFTVMLAVWGQFIDHDITATALNGAKNGDSISCCKAYNTPGLKMHPECFPVPLAPGDPYYQQYNLTCMEFVRSAPAPTCSLGPRQQLNQASSYIDGSVVYGSDQKLFNELRAFSGGRLQVMMTTNNRSLLPISKNLDDGCNRVEMNKKGRYCFLAGDARANENLHLTTMHLLWVRQHNSIADRLAKLNVQWDDEELFQETRRIVGAQLQHITYNEFLPQILGDDVMRMAGLTVAKNGYSKGYRDGENAQISNEFAAAAFRFAHTLLPTLMKKLSNDTSSFSYVEMHKMLFNPFALYDLGGVDMAVRSALDTNLEAADVYFSKEFKEHLFERDVDNSSKLTESPLPVCGLDLVSLNIQRARDHGLQPYVKWRELCGLKTINTFDDLIGVFDMDSLTRIKSIYKSIHDIDLYTGALSEVPFDDGLLGPTFTCLITDQFVRLKNGDRFWYETDERPHAFTLAQLDEIRKTTLARIICDTSDNITRIEPHVMISADAQQMVECETLADLDLTHWRAMPTVALYNSNAMVAARKGVVAG